MPLDGPRDQQRGLTSRSRLRAAAAKVFFTESRQASTASGLTSVETQRIDVALLPELEGLDGP